MHNVKLFESQDHLFILLHESTSKEENGIHSNQYLIKHNDHFVLLDPGGFNVMPYVLAELLRYTTLDKLIAIILSHQDPDVIGGIVSWMSLSSALVYIPEIWTRFIPHIGTKNIHRFYSIPDKRIIEYAMAPNCMLKIIPAHFLHSEGNINVYDPVAKILFTGDIGTGMHVIKNNPFVEDFKKHLPNIEEFHRRYMCSNRAIQIWLKNIAKLEIDMIVPQHGQIYKGQAVRQFIDWFSNLQCGIDLLE